MSAPDLVHQLSRRRTRLAPALLVTALLVSGLGCRRQSPELTGPLLLPAVSPQSDGWSCGPNSLARVLRHHGLDVTYEEVRGAAREGSPLPAVGVGLPPAQLSALGARYLVGARHETETSFERIRELLAGGAPVIALIRLRTRQILGVAVPALHWIVVTGLDESGGEIFYYDTRGNDLRTMPLTSFLARWDWSLHPEDLVRKVLWAHTARSRSIVWIARDRQEGP